jgi:peptidoglycan/xylan/chitin deacetylase (PgdA/CDA1 family)
MKLIDRLATANELGIRTARVEKIIDWMKAAPLRLRRAAEVRIRAATPQFAPTLEQREQFDPMTWEQLSGMDPALISIGSHTLSHPILSTMTDSEIDFEVRESRRILEERLKRSVEFFCYPNGDYDDRIVAVVRKHYRAAVTALPGTIGAGADLYTLPRIPSESSAGLVGRIYRWFRQPHGASFAHLLAGIVD